jgi:hypothetical protein
MSIQPRPVPRQAKNNTVSQFVIESALTKSMYARILLLLGVRSWGFGLLVAVLAFLMYTSVQTGQYSVLMIYASLMVAIYCGAVLFSVLAKKNRRAYLPVKYTFDSSGVVKTTATTRQTVNWSAVLKWRKMGAYYLIYMTKRSFFVIPKARIPEERIGDFEILLSQKIAVKRFGLAR